MRNAARMRCTPELLIQLMQLPEGTSIRDASFDPVTTFVEFLVEHPDLNPVEEGAMLPDCNPMFSSQPSIRFDGWGQENKGAK